MNIVQIPRRFVTSDWGGTETVILQTSKCLLQMGHHTEIFCPNALASQNKEIVEGVSVTRFPYFYPYLGLRPESERLLDQKGGNLFSFSLLRALRNHPLLDLIHLHTGKRIGGIARYVAQKRKIPYVLSLHGGIYDVPQEEAATWTSPTAGTWEWGKVLGWWVGSRRVIEDAAVILCVGKQEQAEVQKRYPHKKVVHLPNGVDIHHFTNGNGAAFRQKHEIPADATLMLTVGRIDPQKNQLFVIEMMPELRKEHPKLHYAVIGHVTNDAYRNQLSQSIQTRSLASCVTVIPGLTSVSQELVDAYHAADLFVLPSIHEPFGIVILEAWAAGVPVLASRVGGVPSVIENEEEGWLFDPNDAGSLHSLLRQLCSDPEKRKALALAGQKKAKEHFSWETITQQLVQYYAEALDENPLH